MVEIETAVVPELVTDDGLKLAVAPVGNPLALKLTVPVKPPVGAMVAEYIAV